jgi:hypothetical protein
MKRYSLATPPTCAGIYLITNKRTKQIYVGQSVGLRRRYNEWKAALASGFGSMNIGMNEAFTAAPDLDEWSFSIYKEMPGASGRQLTDAEDETIETLDKQFPGTVLNTSMQKHPLANPDPHHSGMAILTDRGDIIGVGKAAQIIGRREDTVRTKVRWLKTQGVTQVHVQDLVLDRRDILRKCAPKI